MSSPPTARHGRSMNGKSHANNNNNSALSLDNKDREYLAGLHLSKQLDDPTLLNKVPIIPSPPVFFKHTERNAGSEDPWDSTKSPPGSYKLLASDYAWLADPSKTQGTNYGEEQQQPTPLPEPPLQMQQSRFLSRARTLLVKLRQQVDESTCGALQQGADRLLIYVQQLEEEGMITGGKGGGNAAASGAALAAGGDKGSGGGQKKAGGANAGGTGDSGAGAGKGTGKKDFGEHGCHPVIRGVRELEEVVHAQLGSMFDDCLSDLMEELWAALQYGGSAHSKVEILANRMTHREAEIEEQAQKRVIKLSQELAEVQEELTGCKEALRAETAQTKKLLIANDAKEAQLSAAINGYEGKIFMHDKLQDDIARLKEELLQTKMMTGLRVQAGCKELAAKNEDMARTLENYKGRIKKKDEEMEALHLRCAEQLDMLELAFSRRDVEIKAREAVQDTLVQTMELLQEEGARSLNYWAAKNAGSAVPGTMTDEELLEGEWGVGKAILESARRQGAKLTILELKKWYPEEMPKYESPNKPVEDQPRIEFEEECMADFVPPLWMRLIKAPLQEQFQLPVLLRRIKELYAEKDRDDEYADSSGHPRQGIHNTVYRSFLKQAKKPAEAEKLIASLVQSLRANAGKSPRCALFLSCLGLSMPIIPEAGMMVMRTMDSIMRAPPPAGLPSIVNADMGAVTWVAPARWKAVVTSVLTQATNSATAKAAVKAASELKPDPAARSKPHGGMVDLDAVLLCAMEAWAKFIEHQNLEEQFLDADVGRDGLLSSSQFMELVDLACTTATPKEEEVLRLHQECISETYTDWMAKDLEIGGGLKRVLRGAVSGQAFAKVFMRHGLVGSLPRAGSSIAATRLISTLNVVEDLCHICIEDAKREGLARASYSKLETMISRLEQRKSSLSDQSSAIGEDMITEGWTLVSAAGRTLKQVNEAFSEQRIAMRKQEKAAAAEAEKAAAAERAKAESAAAAEKAKLMSELQRAQMAATKADAAAKMALADVAKQASAAHKASGKPEPVFVQKEAPKPPPRAPRSEKIRTNLSQNESLSSPDFSPTRTPVIATPTIDHAAIERIKRIAAIARELLARCQDDGAGAATPKTPTAASPKEGGAATDETLLSPGKGGLKAGLAVLSSLLGRKVNEQLLLTGQAGDKEGGAERTLADLILALAGVQKKWEAHRAGSTKEHDKYMEVVQQLQDAKRELSRMAAEARAAEKQLARTAAEARAAEEKLAQKAAEDEAAEEERKQKELQATPEDTERLMQIAGQLHGVSNFLCQQLLAGGSLPLPAATATATLAAAPPPAQAAVTIPLAPPPASEASLAQEASLVLPAAPAAAPVAESSSTSPAAPTPSAAANPPQTGTEAASTQGARSSESGEVKPAEGASPAGAEKPAEAVPDPAQQDIPAAEAIPASDTELPAHASPAGNLADSPPAAQDSGVPASDTSAGSVAGSAAAESATAADNGAGSPPAAQEGEVPANASSADLLSIAGKIAGSAAANKAPKSAAADLPSVATDGAAGKQKAATNNAAVSADSQQSPRQRSARKSAQVSPRPEWRFEQQEGQQGSPRPLSPATVTDPASQPQWVLDAQVARIVRAQNEAAMQAVSDAAQALAGNKGLALGLVNRLRATSASASASASVEGHPIASGLPVGISAEALLQQTTNMALHPNAQHFFLGAAAGTDFVDTLQARSKPLHTLSPGKSGQDVSSAPPGLGGRVKEEQLPQPQQQPQQQVIGLQPQQQSPQRPGQQQGSGQQQPQQSPQKQSPQRSRQGAEQQQLPASSAPPPSASPPDPQQLHLMLGLTQQTGLLALEAAQLLAQIQAKNEAQQAAHLAQGRGRRGGSSSPLSLRSPATASASHSPTRGLSPSRTPGSASPGKAAGNTWNLASNAALFHNKLLASHGPLHTGEEEGGARGTITFAHDMKDLETPPPAPPPALPAPFIHTQTAFNAWVNRHNAWRSLSPEQVPNPHGPLSLRKPHPFTHSAASLATAYQFQAKLQHHHNNRPHTAAPMSSSPTSTSPSSQRPHSSPTSLMAGHGAIGMRPPSAPSAYYSYMDEGCEEIKEGREEPEEEAEAVEDDISEPESLPELDLDDIHPGQLLIRCFKLAPQEIEELGVGLLALVRAAGGFPYVAKNGAIMSPAGKMLAPAPGKGPETLAPPFGKSGMPDLEAQRDLLAQLYVHTAGVVAAQQRRAASMKAYESDLELRLKGLKTAAERISKEHQDLVHAKKQALAAVQEVSGLDAHLDTLSHTISHLWHSAKKGKEVTQVMGEGLQCVPGQHLPSLQDTFQAQSKGLAKAHALLNQARTQLRSMAPSSTPLDQTTLPALGASQDLQQRKSGSVPSSPGSPGSPTWRGGGRDALAGLASIKELIQQMAQEEAAQAPVQMEALMLADMLDPLKMFQDLQGQPVFSAHPTYPTTSAPHLYQQRSLHLQLQQQQPAFPPHPPHTLLPGLPMVHGAQQQDLSQQQLPYRPTSAHPTNKFPRGELQPLLGRTRPVSAAAAPRVIFAQASSCNPSLSPPSSVQLALGTTHPRPPVLLPPLLTPPTSPRSQDIGKAFRSAQLPPGEKLLCYSPAQQRRSELSPQRIPAVHSDIDL